MKHICKRDLLRNAANALSAEPTVVTKHGQPEYFVGKIDTVENLSNTIQSLSAFQSSLSFPQFPQSLPATSNVQMKDMANIGMGKPSMNINVKEMQNMKVVDTSGVPPAYAQSSPVVTKGGLITYEKKHSHK